MDTEDFQWRSCARCVACFDLVLSGITLVVGIVAFIIWAAAIPSILDSHPEQYSDGHHFVPLLFAAIFLAIFMEIWGSILLVKATKPGVDPTYALYKAVVWRNINVLFIMLSIIINGLRIGIEYVIITCQLFLILQGTLLILVCKFIKELREAAGSPSISDA